MKLIITAYEIKPQQKQQLILKMHYYNMNYLEITPLKKKL